MSVTAVTQIDNFAIAAAKMDSAASILGTVFPLRSQNFVLQARTRC